MIRYIWVVLDTLKVVVSRGWRVADTSVTIDMAQIRRSFVSLYFYGELK